MVRALNTISKIGAGIPWGRPLNTDGAVLAGHLDGLPECLLVHSCHQHTVCTAAGEFSHGFAGINLASIHGEFCTMLAGKFQLLIGNVHGNDTHAHGHGVLHSDVAEAADAGD